MKKIVGTIFVISLLFAGSASAQMGMMGNWWQNENEVDPSQNSEIQRVLQNIYQSQNVSRQAEVDCSKVSDDQFEKLGDAYMSVMLPNSQQHEAMDNMMGGEGSVSLRQAHTNMGRSYLGCWSNYNSGPVYMPMMNMMDRGWGINNEYYRTYRSHPMMSGYIPYSQYGGNLVSFFFSIFWLIILIVAVVAVVRWFMMRSHQSHHHSNKKPIDILNERYAKGEIEKDEYAIKKKELSS